MSLPAASIVVRNLNRGQRLLRALDSAFAQGFEDFELLLVDDGSSDGSPEAALERYGQDRRFRLIRREGPGNAGAAATLGLEQAASGLVAFLDSDDLWLSDTLEGYVEAAEAEPDRQLFYGDILFTYEDYGLERLHLTGEPANHLSAMLLRGGLMHTLSSVAVRPRAALAVGGYPADFQVIHDFACHLRMALAYDRPFRRLRRPLVRYRVSTDNLMRRFETTNADYQRVIHEGFAHPKAAIYGARKARALLNAAAIVKARALNDERIDRPGTRPVTAVVFVREGGAALRASLESLEAQSRKPEETVLVALGRGRPDVSLGASGRWLAAEGGWDPTAALLSAAAQARGEIVLCLEEGDCWHPDYVAEQCRALGLVADPAVFSFADREGEENADIFTLSSDITACWTARPFPSSFSCLAVERKRLSELPAGTKGSAARLGRALLDLPKTRRRNLPFHLARPMVKRAPV